MKAKEMFKELKYVVTRDDDDWLIYDYKCGYYTQEVQFLKYGGLKKWQLRGNCPITIKRYQAITQQMKELGWLDEEENNVKRF